MTNEAEKFSGATASGIDLLMVKVHAAKILLSVRELIKTGRFAVAELLLREYPAGGAEAAEAFDLRGQTLLAVGLRGHAIAAFEEALAVDTNYKPANEHLEMAKGLILDHAGDSRSKYLVIREWMAGFWSDVEHVLGACLTAEVAGRLPIVYWGSHSRYSSKGKNAWTCFFEPVSEASIDDTQADVDSYFPPYWNGGNLMGQINDRNGEPHPCSAALDCLSRSESVVVSDFHISVAEILPYLPTGHPAAGKSVSDARRIAAARYLKPQKKILDRVNDFAVRNFDGSSILGVHYRGLDKIYEIRDLEDFNSKYPEAIERRLAEEPNAKIFLLTDSEQFATWCSETYPDRVITTAARRSDGDIGLHFLEGDHDRSQLGVEVLIDTLLAARCDRFIGLAGSNVSLFVRDLKEWPEGTCELFGDPYNDRVNVHLKVVNPPPF
jgi:protein O-GlcNAc transferase